MSKILMYRYQGDTEWLVYNNGEPVMVLDDYKIGRIYTVEYKVIEKQEATDE